MQLRQEETAHSFTNGIPELPQQRISPDPLGQAAAWSYAGDSRAHLKSTRRGTGAGKDVIQVTWTANLIALGSASVLRHDSSHFGYNLFINSRSQSMEIHGQGSCSGQEHLHSLTFGGSCHITPVFGPREILSAQAAFGRGKKETSVF